MSGVRSAVAALDAEQRAALDAKVLRGERPPLDWLAFLLPLRAADRGVDAALEAVRVRLRIAWTSAVAGWIIAIVGGSTVGAPVGVAGFVVIVVALAGVVGLHVQRGGLRRKDLAGQPLELVMALLPLLAEDAAPGAPLALTLDVRGHRIQEKSLGAGEPSKDRVYLRIVQTYFRDPFLDARIRFADGAHVHVSGVVQTRSTKKTKKNPRGKIKTKLKTKSRVTYEVRVDFPGRNYATAAARSDVAPGTDRERVREKPGRTAVRERRTIKSSGNDVALRAEHVVDLIAFAYDRVDPARRKKLG